MGHVRKNFIQRKSQENTVAHCALFIQLDITDI